MGGSQAKSGSALGQAHGKLSKSTQLVQMGEITLISPAADTPANPPSRVIGQKHLGLPAGRNGPRKGTPVGILMDQKYLVCRRLIILANP